MDERAIIDQVVVLIRATHLEEAESALVRLRGEHPEVDFSFVEMLLWGHQGHYAQAHAKGVELMRRQSDDPILRFYMARLAVALGRWQEGLALFDTIRGVGPFGGPYLTQKRPLWGHQPLFGQTLFLGSEGGLGDAVCFARFAAQYAKLGAKVVLGGYESMFPLLRKIPGVSAVVDLSAVDKTDFDFWLPALSSPRLLNLELNQISGQPYIECPQEAMLKWKNLTQSGKPKIALVWQGSEGFAEDYVRSIACEKFKKILSHSEFQFFSLRGNNDKSSLVHPNLRNMGEHIGDPQDLAGCLRNMDLVISVDSGPAHLAGAMGVPTLLLNRVMGWFTFGAQPDTTRPQESPWYDSMAIIQQKRWGQWEEVLVRAEQILLSRQWPKNFVPVEDPIYHPDSPPASPQLVELVETKHGSMMTVPNDYFVGKALELYGEYSCGEEELFKKIIKSGDHVVEAGAHLGALTILFGQLTGPQGSVIAFEPQHFLCSINRANMGLQNLRHVDVREEGLAEQERFIVAPAWDYSRVGNFGAVTLKEAKTSPTRNQVKLITLDSLNLARLDFMKIDIEGMEVSALLGAEKTIQRCRPVLFVENDRREQSEALLSLLKKWNYQVEPFITPLFNPQNFKQQSQNIYANAASHNILARPL